MTAIGDLIKALVLWLQLRNAEIAYTLPRQIEADIEEDEKTILALRALGTDASNIAADRLRERILRSQGIVANLPTASAVPQGGGPNPISTGGVHPAGG